MPHGALYRCLGIAASSWDCEACLFLPWGSCGGYGTSYGSEVLGLAFSSLGIRIFGVEGFGVLRLGVCAAVCMKEWSKSRMDVSIT